MTETHWDAICVGAGLTSLAFGAQLVNRHPGTRVLVIDKHAVPGGYASLFRRPKAGAYFDCSLHKISGTKPDGGNFYRLFAELGLDGELALEPHQDHFEACLPDRHILLPNCPRQVEAVLAARFPSQADGLRTFFEELERHGRDAYYQYQILDGSYEVDFSRLRWAHRNLKDITLAEALDARFTDGYLKEILAAPAIYVGGFAEDLSYLYFLHVLYATLVKGNAYVGGGAQRLSDVLSARILDHGGQMLLRTPVDRIVPGDGDEPHRVETLRGTFHSRAVYINASPHQAVGRLFGDHAELRATRSRLEELKPSRSTTTLYVTTDADPADLGLNSIETMIFSSTPERALSARRAAAASDFDSAAAEQAFWHASPMEVTNYHALNPEAGRVICLNVLDSIEHWPDRRSPEYKPKKARARETLLGRLIAHKPGFEGRVTYAEVASPQTYLRFTGNTAGAGYGAAVGAAGSGHGFHYFFPFKGIHFLSTWVAGSGYEAAFVFAERKVRAWQG